MRLHTNLTMSQVCYALSAVKARGVVADGVHLAQLDLSGSRSHDHRWDLQLGAADGGGLPACYKNRYGKRQKCRRTRNSGTYGAEGQELRFAATWEEWGWFMAEIFRRDPRALFGTRGRRSWGYDGVDDFHEKTEFKFYDEETRPRERSLITGIPLDDRETLIEEVTTLLHPNPWDADPPSDPTVFGPEY